jgi:mannose-6-phosphate isomerase
LSAGQHIHIPLGALHQIRALGPERLVFLEIQVGEVLDENDIVRLDDDYGRAGECTGNAQRATIV